MRKGCAAVALLCALVGSIPVAASSSAYRCSIGTTAFSASLGETQLLAEFIDGVVEAGPGPVESSEMTGHSTRPDPSGRVWGQYIRVHGALGWANEVFGVSLAGGADTAIVVVWDYDAGCAVTRYGGPLPLGVAGDTVLVRARLRDRSEWVDDVPTYDSFWGGENVFEVVSLTAWRGWILDMQKEYPYPRWEQTERLTPTEVFHLIEALPATCDYVWAPASAAARYVRVQLAYLDDQRYPVQSLLDSHRRRMQRNAAEVAWCYSDPRRHWWEEW